jgi:hypothetical protein
LGIRGLDITYKFTSSAKDINELYLYSIGGWGIGGYLHLDSIFFIVLVDGKEMIFI